MIPIVLEKAVYEKIKCIKHPKSKTKLVNDEKGLLICLECALPYIGNGQFEIIEETAKPVTT